MKRVSIFTSLVSLLTIALILMGSGAYAEEYIGDSGHAQTEVDTDAISSEGIQSLRGSFVKFDDSVGSDACYIPGAPQTFCFHAAPSRESTGVGIIAYDGIARLDNFGGQANLGNRQGLLYLTSLDIGDDTFAVYDPVTNEWTTLAAYETGCQMAVSSSGGLYAYGYDTGTIDRYDPDNDTWTAVMAAPAGASGIYCNLEISNAGEFLYTESQNTNLWYTTGAAWNTIPLPFTTNAMGDYDPTTNKYIIGEWSTTNAHMIDLHTWSITDYASSLINGEYSRSGVVLGGRYYFETAGSNFHSFELVNPAGLPFDHNVSPGWYTSAAADRFRSVIYSASLNGTALNRFNPATNALTPLTGYSLETWHSSLAFVPSPVTDAWKEAPDFAEPGEVITYTITIEANMLMDGMYMVDPLPAGVEYAGNLTWTDGEAWYDADDNTVYWEYHEPEALGEPVSPRPGVYDPNAVVDLVGAVEPSGAPLPEGDVKTFTYPLFLLWDNGPLVTHPGGGYGGADASRLQTTLGMNTLGFGHQLINGNRMSDDFEVIDPSGWWIETLTFFAYQTGAPIDPSTITGLYYQIWDGPPDDPASNIVWGDLVTNRLVDSTWTNIYRDSETAPEVDNRPIMASTTSAGLWLPPGTYWLDWTSDGTLTSGPWAPPITILGETTTGNALQYTMSSGAWAPALDSGTLTQQGMPFIIEGQVGFESVLVEISFDVTVTGLHGDIILNEALAGWSGNDLAFTATTAVVGIPGINIDPLELQAEVVIDKSAVKNLSICNAGTAPLEWDLIIAADPIMMSVLIIQDQYPWGYSSIQDILTTKGIAYDQIDSSQIPAVDLSPYVLVIVPSNQPGDFYTTWNDNLAKFEGYVENGGALWLSTAAFSEIDPEPLLPGGVINSTDLDDYNEIVEPTHPWLIGVPDPIYGTHASHDSYTNLYPGSVVIARAQTSQNPTLVDYNLGDGRILITGQTLEFAWMLNWDAAPILQNSLLDMYYWAVASDIPWLSEDLNTGQLLPGECQEVKMTFDTTGMDLGNYSANLLLFSNDPLNPISVVPVELMVVEPVEFFIYLPVALKN